MFKHNILVILLTVCVNFKTVLSQREGDLTFDDKDWDDTKLPIRYEPTETGSSLPEDSRYPDETKPATPPTEEEWTEVCQCRKVLKNPQMTPEYSGYIPKLYTPKPNQPVLIQAELPSVPETLIPSRQRDPPSIITTGKTRENGPLYQPRDQDPNHIRKYNQDRFREYFPPTRNQNTYPNNINMYANHPIMRD